MPSDNNLSFPVERSYGQTAYYSFPFGPMPASFSTTPTMTTSHWSFYATLNLNTTSPPAAPTGLEATAGNAQVSLTWTASAGATSYDIYRSTTSGGETLYKSGIATTSFTDTGLSNGTTYYYEAAAVNSAGTSAKSGEVSATPQVAPPAAPTNLKATAGNAQVALTWTASTGADSYEIYRGTSSGGETLLQTGITGTSFTNTGLTNGDNYYYQVTAVNSAGQSNKSNQVTAWPQAPGGTIWVEDSTPIGAALAADGGDAWTWRASNPAPYSGSLDQQSNVASGEHQHYFYHATQTVTVQTGDTLYANVYLNPASPPSEVMLQWNVSGSWNHRAYWGANDIGWGSNGTVSRQYMGALPATGAWVRLAVLASDVGLSGATVSGMAFTLYGGQADWDHAGTMSATLPAAPTGLTASAGNAQVALSWTASTGAASYDIYRGTTSGGETLLKTGITGTSYTDTGLTNGTTYYYEVSAANAGGQSGKSNQVSAMPSASETMGETTILSGFDNGKANTLIAQQTTLTAAGTLQSLSFDVTNAAGNLVLGVYDATGSGGAPGNLLAQTSAFTPKGGWNTANVITPVSLPVGTYWLAFLASDNNLAFPADGSGTSASNGTSFGPMPGTFLWPFEYSGHHSLYATLGVPELLAGTPIANSHAPSLTQKQLDRVVQHAIADWAATGLTAAQISVLQRTQFVIAGLPLGVLGDTVGNTITIDPNADGYGWFLGNGKVPPHKIDLLTVVSHELGHELGQPDISTQANPNNIMDDTLGPGVRRLPQPSQFDDASSPGIVWEAWDQAAWLKNGKHRG